MCLLDISCYYTKGDYICLSYAFKHPYIFTRRVKGTEIIQGTHTFSTADFHDFYSQSLDRNLYKLFDFHCIHKEYFLIN